MKQYPEFIQKLKTVDSRLYENITRNFDLCMSPGVVDVKTKFLILLAVDAMTGNDGIRMISERARSMGISNSEIGEALRIAYMVATHKAIFTGMSAF